MKCTSRALCHSACLKSMLRTITMQGLTFAITIAAEKVFNARVEVKL